MGYNLRIIVKYKKLNRTISFVSTVINEQEEKKKYTLQGRNGREKEGARTIAVTLSPAKFKLLSIPHF